ncbi:SIR2 family protein [Pseudarthrobacter sp. LMD1-1-1.1]|uniref:SIR2 family protein n=1 Tax=Pseudarthrobacter sp. LMD1-1-1.1 TaxID=3135242 RepID=UPI0034359E78
MPASFDTHRHARDLIAREESTPNRTHAALVRVASSVGQFRIVTTNFDNHLLTAAVTEGIEVADTWIGPALPLGDDFTGLVHLHGSVLREPRELVLTDGDFGRAYLTNAWATRFLLPMFQSFTVLFIGYSHDDPIMRYLALGLPSETPRYAFTKAEETNDAKWSRLRVNTIAYPVRDNDHGALVAALEAWDLRARMGQTEHHTRIIELVTGGPTLTPVDYDYLVARLVNAVSARHFVQAVTDVDPDLQVAWLQWAEGLPEFKALFDNTDGDAAATVLGNWFCHDFIALPDLHGAALQTVQRLGHSFSNSLFQRACWAADKLSEVNAEAGRRWKAFLATSVEGRSMPVATETLLSYVPDNRPEDLTVLRAALRPYLVLKQRWYLDDADDLTAAPDAEVRWRTEEDALTGHVLKVIEVRAPGDSILGNVLEESLSAAYDLLDSYHGQRPWDPLSVGRSAIEPHEQDEFLGPVDAVITGLRAYGEKALTSRPDLPDRWWSCNGVLFRRLAIHLLALDASRTADEKISWLLRKSVLFESDLKHETYSLLKVTTASASHEVRNQLLKSAQAGPSISDDVTEFSPDDDRHIRYATYNLLVWLTQVAPDWSEAGTALAAAQAANPDFAPRENPDFDTWMTSGTWGGKLPMEPADFIRLFEADPADAIEVLLARDYSKRNFDHPEWRDALSLVSQVAESRPEIGDQFWAMIDELGKYETQAKDLREAIIGGWAKATLDGIADKVVARVASQVGVIESARSVSRFLLEQVNKQVDSDETPTLASMRRTALRLWEEQVRKFTHPDGADLVSNVPLHLNSWPGDLAHYWTVEVDRRWRKHRDDWAGLSDEERDALTNLLDGPPQALDATQPALASYLYFFFMADETFAVEHVLPLFHDDVTAGLAWNSYLRHPRHNDKLLAAGLLDSTIAQWARLEALKGAQIRYRFFALVISIASFAGITPESRRALLDQSVLTDDGAHEADFAQAVVRFLSEDKIDGGEVWRRWLRDHLAERLRDLPRTLNIEDLTCWADVVPYLGDGIPEAAKMLSNRRIGLGKQALSPRFPEGTLSVHGPVLSVHFAERIYNTSQRNYFTTRYVNQLISTVRETLGDGGVQPLKDAAAAKGFTEDDSYAES